MGLHVQSGTDQAQAYFQIYAEAIGQVRKWADPDALTPEQVRALARQRSARRASFQDVRAQPTQTTVMTSAEQKSYDI